MSLNSLSRALKEKRSLPLQLKFLLTLIVGLTAVLGILIESGTYQHRYAAKTIGVDSAPSVFTAYEIKIKAQILDADTANILASKPGQDMVSVRDFEVNRVKLAEALVGAAENITFDDSEREPIRKLQDAVSEYLADVARAQALHEKGDPAYIVEYHNSLSVLKEQILPSADALEAANAVVLEKTYSTQGTESVITFGLVLVAGLALMAVLVYTQVYVTRNFKRRFNLGLLGASALVLLITLYTSFSFLTQSALVRNAKQDAYDSVIALYGAKSFAHEANAASSRFLLDKPQADTHEQAFQAAVDKLLTLGNGLTFDKVVSMASSVTPQELKKQLDGRTGTLFDELRNITFDHEQEAATAAVKSLGVYVATNAQLRQLEKAGKHDEAVAMGIGMSKGESAWAFSQFNQSLDAVLEINRDFFKKDIASAQARVAALPYINPIVGILIALSAFFGLRPRLKEFPASAFKKLGKA